MKSNKGFTLIELLAVIVILAIIALIATPTILGVIDKAKQGAAGSSALGYVDAVEKQIMINEMDTSTEGETKKFDLTTDKTYAISELTAKGVEVKGDQPAEGSAVKLNTKGEVSAAALKINDYYVYYNGKKADAAKTASEAYNALVGELTAE